MKKMRDALWALCLLALFSGAASAASPEPKLAGEVLVVLKNELKEPLTAADVMSAEGRFYVARVAQTVGARVAHTYDALSEAGGAIFALFASESKTTEELLEALKKCPEVLAASPNREVRIQAEPKEKTTPKSGAPKPPTQPKKQEIK